MGINFIDYQDQFDESTVSSNQYAVHSVNKSY